MPVAPARIHIPHEPRTTAHRQINFQSFRIGASVSPVGGCAHSVSSDEVPAGAREGVDLTGKGHCVEETWDSSAGTFDLSADVAVVYWACSNDESSIADSS